MAFHGSVGGHLIIGNTVAILAQAIHACACHSSSYFENTKWLSLLVRRSGNAEHASFREAVRKYQTLLCTP